ncbi:MAG: hypothetical protein WCO33_00720 [bacterium]
MKRLERKLFTGATHLAEKGATFGSEIGGGLVGVGIGLLVGAVSGGTTLAHGLDKGWKLGSGLGRKIGKSVSGTAGKILRKTKDLGNLINDPFDELSNALIRFLIGLIGLGYFFDELIANKIIENKKQILTVLLAILLSISLLFGSFVKLIYASVGGVLVQNGVLMASEYDLDVLSSLSPSGSPFGKEGYINTQITAGYLDQSYYNNFGKWHEAIDIIPTSNYYSTDKAYKKTGYTYIYATCDGVGNVTLDKAGAFMIEIVCSDLLHKVLYVHESSSFIPFSANYSLRRGQAIGIMGCTGVCYGAHVHYAVSIKKIDGTFEFTNPIAYL